MENDPNLGKYCKKLYLFILVKHTNKVIAFNYVVVAALILFFHFVF